MNAGDRKPGYATMHLPLDLSAGAYSIQARLYDPASRAPAALVSTAGVRAGEAVELGLLEIGDTMRLRPPGTHAGS